MLSEKIQANEHIRAKQIELGLGNGDRLPFFCECHDIACRSLIRLTAAEYGEARAAPGRWVVLEGHRYVGRVVSAGEGYVMTESWMDERTRRIGENEALYRAINEKIEGLNEAFGMVTESMAVVCECGQLACTEQIELDLPTYEHVRSDSALFVVIPGHEIPDVEDVVEPHDRFNVIRKRDGGPAELAEQLDERS